MSKYLPRVEAVEKKLMRTSRAGLLIVTVPVGDDEDASVAEAAAKQQRAVSDFALVVVLRKFSGIPVAEPVMP